MPSEAQLLLSNPKGCGDLLAAGLAQAITVFLLCVYRLSDAKPVTSLAFDLCKSAQPGIDVFNGRDLQAGRDAVEDHSQGGAAGLRLVGPQYGNLQNAKIILFDRREERNLAYSGGEGEGSDRVVSELEDTTRTASSPYNRREVWVDARNTTSTAEREDRGYQALEKHRPVRTLTGNLVDTRGFRFGIHYGFGDLVTATAFGYTVDCHIDKISAVVRSPHNTGATKVETLSIGLRGEL